MGNILTLSVDANVFIPGVEVLNCTSSEISFKFKMDNTVTEESLRARFGEGENSVYYMTVNSDDPDDDTITEYYGYTKIAGVVLTPQETGTVCVVTMRKPSFDEFVEDVFKEIHKISKGHTDIVMNIGGTFSDITSDTVKLMRSQMGGAE